MASTPPVPGRINPNAINSAVPPVPGRINPNAINSNNPVPNSHNANITAGSIGQDIFKGTTNGANLIPGEVITKGNNNVGITESTPVNQNNGQPNIATKVNDTPTIPQTTTPKSTNINITDTTKTPTTPTTIDPKGDPQGAINQWKTNGSNINQLETLVENKYGTTATINGDTLTADINGQTYNWKVDGQGNAIKSLAIQNHNNPDQYFTDLQNGVTNTDINVINSPAYLAASDRKTNLDKYSNMNTQELSVMINQGKLLPGTQLYNDLKVNNPDILNNAVKLANANSTNNGTKTNLTQTISDLMTKMLSTDNTNQLVNALSGNKDVQNFSKEILKSEKQRNQYLDQINAVREDVRKDLGGRSTSKGYFNALVYDRTRKLTRLAKLEMANITSLGGQLQNLTSNIKYGVQVQQNQQRINQSKLNTALNYYSSNQRLNQTQAYQNASLGISQQNANTSAFNAQNTANRLNSDIKRIGTSTNQYGAPIPVYGKYNSSTGNYDQIDMGKNSGTNNLNNNILNNNSNIDYSNNKDLIAAHPNEASFKNNNPTGMTWGISSNLKNILTKAGVNFSKGTYRPINEGGNYIKFNSVADGLKAYKIALTKAGSDSVYNRLATWVGTKDTASNDRYAKDIMKNAGIDRNAKFSDLTAAQSNKLMETQLKKESPAFYNELVKGRQGVNKYADINNLNDIKLSPKSNQSQNDSLGFGLRMNTSSLQMKTMEDKYAKSWTFTEYLSPRGDHWYIPNFIKSTERKNFEQAQRNFINSILRQESGAAIADSEFANAAQQYFPQPGDSVDTMKQKRQNREQVIQNMMRGAGIDSKGRQIIDIYSNFTNSNNPTINNNINSNTDISVTQGVNKYFK